MIKVEGANGFNRHAYDERGGGQPMPTIQAGRAVKVILEDGYGSQDRTGKPAPTIRAGRAPTTGSTYRAPMMAEVNAARSSSGLKAASLFAGGGGSSTGWALAGFDVVWANEFTQHAADTYTANHPAAIVDRRSIRDVQLAEILEAIGMKVGELDVLDGSPPCDAFSTAGKGSKGWGKKKNYYTGEHRQRTDDLFFEYVRILEGLQPRAFIAENVTGLIKGKSKGRFLQILKALKATGYKVEVRVLDAQWLGVPQCRQRVIFQGLRDGGRMFWPKPHKRRISLAEAIGSKLTMGAHGWFGGREVQGEPCPTVAATGLGSYKYQVEQLPPSRAKAYEPGGEAYNFTKAQPAQPAPTITVSSPGNDIGHWEGPRKLTIPELKAICSFPLDYDIKGTYGQQWAVCGMSVPPLMMWEIAKSVRKGLEDA